MSRPPIDPDKTAAGIALDPQTLDRVVPESRRPDGSVRKQLKIRPGFTPQEDVKRFRGTKQAQMDAVVLPKGHIIGWVAPSSSTSSKPASKSAKKNAKRKEKRDKEKEKVETAASPIPDNWDDEEEEEKEGEGANTTDTQTDAKSPPTVSMKLESDESPATFLVDKFEKLDVE